MMLIPLSHIKDYYEKQSILAVIGALAINTATYANTPFTFFNQNPTKVEHDLKPHHSLRKNGSP